MKIALIRRRYSPHGGAEKYVDRLAQKLLSLGHEVHLFSTEWPRRPGLVLHPLPFFRGPGLFKLFHFNRKAEKAVDRKAFEVIQSFEKTACQDIYRAGEGCHREWLQQRKKYEPFHKRMGAAINPFHWLTLALERRLFERSDTRFFIANSQRGRQEILTHYRTAPEKIKVIYNAVENSSEPAAPEGTVFREGEEKILLFVGSGFRRKGLYFLLRALPVVLQEVQGPADRGRGGESEKGRPPGRPPGCRPPGFFYRTGEGPRAILSGSGCVCSAEPLRTLQQCLSGGYVPGLAGGHQRNERGLGSPPVRGKRGGGSGSG